MPGCLIQWCMSSVFPILLVEIRATFLPLTICFTRKSVSSIRSQKYSSDRYLPTINGFVIILFAILLNNFIAKIIIIIAINKQSTDI